MKVPEVVPFITTRKHQLSTQLPATVKFSKIELSKEVEDFLRERAEYIEKCKTVYVGRY